MNNLTPQQRKILDKLLSLPFPGRDELRQQLKDCQTKPTGDSDNYGSIYLLPRNKVVANVPTRVPVEGLTQDSDGEDIDILLHVIDGLANELEIVKFDGTPLKSEINPDKIKVVLNNN